MLRAAEKQLVKAHDVRPNRLSEIGMHSFDSEHDSYVGGRNLQLFDCGHEKRGLV